CNPFPGSMFIRCLNTGVDGEVRRDKERTGEAMRDKERPGEARRDQERPEEARRDQERQGETRRGKERPGELRIVTCIRLIGPPVPRSGSKRTLTGVGEMGCGLRKIRQTEDSSPGKIYSTLKRPQVETKIGVTYTYCHLDFLVGKEDGTSTLCLSSVRELPSQLQDLYQQGFVLTVVHPFVHPCGQEPASIQQQLYRVVLTKLPDSSEKSPSDFEPYHLKLEECLSAEHIPMAEHIQGYVKKQIQDAADLGITFAGFVQEPAGIRPRTAARAARGEPALSLHSSPSSLRSSELTASPSHQGEPDTLGEGVAENGSEDWRSSAGNLEAEEASGHAGGDAVSDDTSAALTLESFEGQDDTPSHNNNKAKGVELSDKTTKPSLSKNGVELFGLFNYPGRRRGPLKYYTVKVPLRVRAEEAGMPAVEADWLDHMTQHFNGGASLVDGYFHLGNENDKLPKVIEGVFVFQEAEPSTSTAYDAIVVEQWSVVDVSGLLPFRFLHSTVQNTFEPRTKRGHLTRVDPSADPASLYAPPHALPNAPAPCPAPCLALVADFHTLVNVNIKVKAGDGVQVKTDYIPLLQSLASFGWRLTCVLPTPIVKTNSNGSLSTKQIVFLQRPALPAKKRQSKKLIFRTRNKSGKNSVKDAPKNKKKKNAAAAAAEKELEGPKLQDGAEKPENANEMTGASEGRSGQSDGELAQEGVGEGKKRSEGRGEVETEVSREGGVELAGQRQDEQAGKTECDDQAAEVKDGEMESEEGGSDRNKESPQTCRQQESGEGQKQSANDSSWENQQESSITVDGSAPAANGSPANQE
ncbi:hypothetical protein P4O66_004881, partial [Electrophorus voltai]